MLAFVNSSLLQDWNQVKTLIMLWFINSGITTVFDCILYVYMAGPPSKVQMAIQQNIMTMKDLLKVSPQ